MVNRSIKEALDLRGVKINRHDASSSCCLEHICHQTSGDWLTSLVLFVLAGVWEKRGNHGDALGTGALHGVHHQKLLHEPVVDRSWMSLNYEGINATNTSFVADKGFTIGKVIGGYRH